MSNDWITDRRPDPEKDGRIVYRFTGHTIHCSCIRDGEAWKPIPKCEPYVKPKRYRVVNSHTSPGSLCIFDIRTGRCVAFYIYGQVHAERIAAIFEEVMP